ncbi:MAG: response regulator, partial [Bryobacteraceae bacterium]|nr:response regulator [Bryobacteraceae bacterium]
MSVRATSVISVLVVDDEQLARDEIAFLFKDFPDFEVLSFASNGLEALDLIEKLEPDVVFLDVQMPGLDGIGVVKRLQEKDIPLPYFVFATAFDTYAVEAFRLEAADYLLKPIDKGRLERTLDRIRRLSDDRGRATPVKPPVSEAPAGAAAVRSKIVVKAANR